MVGQESNLPVNYCRWAKVDLTKRRSDDLPMDALGQAVSR